MPEVHFTIQLPDGSQHQCYSPSTIVRDYFKANDEFTVTDFVSRSRVAYTAASERVRAKFGFSCSSAASQLEMIETLTRTQPADGRVRILSI